MLKNKMLFLFQRYNYDNNKILTSKNLSFLPITLFIIITRSLKFIVKNESDENNFDINHSKNISNKKKLTLTFKILKKKMIQKFNFIDIVEIDALIYYYFIKNKENKLFSLTINKIHNILI